MFAFLCLLNCTCYSCTFKWCRFNNVYALFYFILYSMRATRNRGQRTKDNNKAKKISVPVSERLAPQPSTSGTFRPKSYPVRIQEDTESGESGTGTELCCIVFVTHLHKKKFTIVYP